MSARSRRGGMTTGKDSAMTPAYGSGSGAAPSEPGGVFDHGASETHLNRLYYFLRYLRAMLVHLTLMAIAMIASAAFGVSGFYVLADRSVAALNADLAADGLTPPAAPALLALTGVAFLAFLFVWAYHAVIKLWPVSLRALAAIVIALYFVLIGAAVAPEILGFGHGRFHPLFTGLYIGSLGFILFVAGDVALGLIAATRAPDRASFRATLDPRLAPSRLVYIGKLLDLPRRPFRSWRLVSAWVLQLAAMVMLIASIGYLASFGAVAAKSTEFMADPLCAAVGAAECRAASFDAGVQIIAWMALAVAGLKASALLGAAAKRIGTLTVEQALRADEDRFLLYLRPFTADGVPLPKPKLPPVSAVFSFRPFPTQLEEELFDVADGYRPLIAIGKPGDSPSGGRAHRTFLKDDAWRAYVIDKIRRADAIVMVIDQSEGVRWEIDRLVEERAEHKTLFYFAPAAKDPEIWSSLEHTVQSALGRGAAWPKGYAFRTQALAFSLHGGAVREYVNAHWSAVSYRTVFSEYLSERAGAASK